MLFHNLNHYLLYQTYVHTTIYHSSGLIRNLMFNGSIYYVFMFAGTVFLLGWSDLFMCVGLLLLVFDRYFVEETISFGPF